MTLTGENQSTQRQSRAGAALYTANPILIGAGLKAGLSVREW